MNIVGIRYSGYGKMSKLLFAHFPPYNNKSIIYDILYTIESIGTI